MSKKFVFPNLQHATIIIPGLLNDPTSRHGEHDKEKANPRWNIKKKKK